MTRKIKIKDASELNHISDQISLEVVDKQIIGVTIYISGEEITIQRGDQYGNNLSILKDEPQNLGTVYFVKGKLHGYDICSEQFDDKFAAEEHKKQLEYETSYSDLYIQEIEHYSPQTKFV
jgi:hypothetical protein